MFAKLTFQSRSICIGWLFSIGTLVCIESLPLLTASTATLSSPIASTSNDDPAKPPATEPNPLDDEFANKIKPFLSQYCLKCHSGNEAKGDMQLSKFSSLDDVKNDLESWSSVLDVLQNGDMPPGDSKQPQDNEVELLEQWILATIAAEANETSSLSVIRRLNSAEYENTIRDLFRLPRNCFNNPARLVHTEDYFQPETGKMPRYVLAVSHFSNSHRRHSDLPGVSMLPVDPPVEHGFANDQAALSISPLMMENYLDVASALLNSSEFAQISALWQSLFVGQSDDPDELLRQAQRQLPTFLERAFRRPVDATELAEFFELFQSEFAETASYTSAMKTTVSAILISPGFLFRGELSRHATNTDQEYQFGMATRLSYFLWGSMPDDQLFQAARENRLHDPAELRRQVRRMMDDKRIKSLSTDFGMQWLKLQKVASVIPDKDLFPDYYRRDVEPPAISMMIEQMLLFETVMVENRSILDFINADFGYLNRSLMDWYYLKPAEVAGFTPNREDTQDFFRIKWPSIHRGGVVTSGAMLVSTSTTTRSSPVYRGSWILDVVFNNPPPAPPANVPPLIGNDEESAVPINIRKRLEQHRRDPACASCHDRMDPLGLALEQFDAVGRWRKNYGNGDEIDASGELDGDPFFGPARFKNVLLRQKDKFVQAFVEHTMKYALGRPLHFSDEPEIRRITEIVLNSDCRFDAVIENVVLSDLFRQLPKEN